MYTINVDNACILCKRSFTTNKGLLRHLHSCEKKNKDMINNDPSLTLPTHSQSSIIASNTVVSNSIKIMYLKFSSHAYFRTRNSNLKSVSNKNQLEISRNLIRDNRILSNGIKLMEHCLQPTSILFMKR